MEGSNPQLWILSAVILGTTLSLLGSVTTWYLSRAKKVREVEDQVLAAVRTLRARAEQVEVTLAEWQTTIKGILAEVEDFFDRSVKERKRAMLAANKVEGAAAAVAAQDTAPDLDHMGNLPRSAQLELVRRHFEQ